MRVAHGGARIDRGRSINFTFDGRRLKGLAGDTLASALLANSVRLVGRSFKYHRPRGIVSAGSEEPNALVTIGEGGLAEPNTRATVVELYEALVARSQNRWPSLQFDLGAATGLASGMFPAGFYYKTFFGPARRWTRLYEPAIRRMAGLGPAPTAPDPERYDKVHAHCETLIIGGGASGRVAAQAAAGEGRVILVDEGIGAPPISGVLILKRTTAFGRNDGGLVMACERCADHLPPGEREGPRQRLWQIRARNIVLATGAHQQPLIFGNNDLPGIMLAEAGLAYLRDYGVLVGGDVVLAGASDRLSVIAESLAAAGAKVTIVDFRKGAHVLTAHGTNRVVGCTVRRGGQDERIACDAILMDGGWQPAVHLHAHVGGKVGFDPAKSFFIPLADEWQPSPVGACGGDLPGRTPVPPVIHPKAFIDFQNDVTIADIDLAAREGFVSVEHLKRYTTTGMATDQGKLSNLNALSRLADTLGAAPGAVGVTTFRPPYTPVTFGALAGRDRGLLIDPWRRTPMHAWHAARGAVFEDVGQWKRARYYPQAGEDMHAAVLREGRAVRESVGMLDASTLGKIDIKGPDAAEFLNRVYANPFLKLEIGRCRYGVMCGEDGMVMDDGVTTRIGPHRYLMTTTTGNAARVLDHLEDLLQTEWPALKVWLTSVTEHWAAAVVTGPKARDVLAGVCEGVDLANAAFPHLSMRDARVAGIAARIYRISFTGELSYEVHVDARRGLDAWEALIEAGRPFGLTPYGTEAMHVLRAEKGYIIIGQETDGSATPDDVGLGWAIGKAKPDFIGKRSLARAGIVEARRKQLVGLFPDAVIPEGAQITATADERAMLGHVTSSYWSPALDRPFALAMIEEGRSKLDKTVYARFEGRVCACRIVMPVIHDPDGRRMNG